MYGPGIDNDFATNNWVYLYYSPPTVEDVKLSTGEIVTQTTPTANAPNTGESPAVWDPWVGYFQLSAVQVRRRHRAAPAHLDLASEQEILRVPVNRGACCHVAGDIDFDDDGNLWLVTGDDTPAGGGGSGGFGPFNDQLTATGLYNAPHVDARRSSLNTNDLRGKILRMSVKEGDITPEEANDFGGAYTVPPGNLFPVGMDKTRPEIYAMGFRNPFRIQVDENDIAYITDYSPDSRVPQNFRGPAGTGRVMVVRGRRTTAGRCATAPTCRTTAGISLTQQPLDDPAEVHECDNPERGPQNTSRWNVERRTDRGARTGVRPAGHEPRGLVLVQRQHRGTPARDAVLRVLQRLGSHQLPAAVPRARIRRSRTARRGEVHLRPSQPRHDEAPAVLRRRDLLRRVHPGHPARDPARLRGPRLQAERLVQLRRADAGAGSADGQPVRVRQPDGHAVRRVRALLPAHVRRRVLQHQQRRRDVPLGLRQGAARSDRRALGLTDRRSRAVDRAVLERGVPRPRSG